MATLYKSLQHPRLDSEKSTDVFYWLFPSCSALFKVGRLPMISYLMSQSCYIMCRTFHCDLQTLNCFHEFSLGDRAMVSLQLGQFRHFLGQAQNGILFCLRHGCGESRFKAQSEFVRREFDDEMKMAL